MQMIMHCACPITIEGGLSMQKFLSIYATQKGTFQLVQ